MIQRVGRIWSERRLAWIASLLWVSSVASVQAAAPPDSSDPELSKAAASARDDAQSARDFERITRRKPPEPTPAEPANEPAREANPSLMPEQRQSPQASWERLWSVTVGSGESGTRDGKVEVALGQIAVRGRLVVVASRGTPGVNDDRDGVYVVDGNDGLPDDQRIIRHMRLTPSGDEGARNQQSAPGSTDAVGVALDGDFVVFGSYGGIVRKARLDGATAWSFAGFAAGSRPGLAALVDVNGDGWRDAVVPVIPSALCTGALDQCGAAWATLTIALDGRDGHELWRVARSDERSAARCRQLTIGHEAGSRLLTAGCVSLRERPTNEIFAAFDFDGEVAALPDDLDTERELMPVAEGLASPASEFYGVEVAGSGLDVVDMGSEVTVGAVALEGPLQSLPSLGDVNRDAVWDVVVVAGGELSAYSTGATGRAMQTLWRTDAAASGTSPFYDTPSDYAVRIEPRDDARWLQRAAEPTQEAGCTLLAAADMPAPMLRDPVLGADATGTANAPVVAELVCRHRYGINEGRLVIAKGGEWRQVPGAPWPVLALGCSGSRLLLEGTDGSGWSMATPLPWELHALAVGGALMAAALLIAWLLTGRQRHVAHAEPQKQVRRAIIDDSPRTLRDEAHPDQKRLLEGLLSVIDNQDTRPPISIALYGDWGSGKSTLMQMLRSELTATGRYIDVWFNAWRYQREKELAPALLQRIVDEVGRRTDWLTRLAVLWHRLRTASGRQVAYFMLLLIAVVLLFAISLRASSSSTTSIGGAVGTLVSVVAFFAGAANRLLIPLFKVFELEPAKLLSSMDSKRRIEFVGAFTQDFEQVCKRMPKDTRLIVFIDDLDRCPPDRIVNVLETLSMLADTGSAFFVLAIDAVSVRRAIELTYTRLLSIERKESPKQAATFASRYLEKMITLGVNVPKLAAADIRPERDPPRPARKPAADNGYVWRWFRDRVLPGAPVTTAILVSALALVWVSVDRAAVETLLDRGAQLVFEPGAETAAKADAKAAASADAERGTSAGNAADHERRAHARDEAEATPRAGQPPTGNASDWTPPQLPRADRSTPRAAPTIIAGVDGQTPARGRLLSEVVILGFYALGSIALLALLAMFGAEARRRKRAESAPPMVKDSDEFLGALESCRAQLSPNPRGVVRFTNLCRFLYPVVEAHRDAKGAWQKSFFEGLRMRWSGEARSGLPAWLEAELDRWIPATGQHEELGSERPRPPETPLPDSDPSSLGPNGSRVGGPHFDA